MHKIFRWMPRNCPYAEGSLTDCNANGLCISSTLTARYWTQFKRFVHSQYDNGSLPQHNFTLKSFTYLDSVIFADIIMSPPFRVWRHIVFPRASVCLSVTNRVRSITWKLLKLDSWIFIQISISMRWCAEWKNGNSAFYTFWVISLWTLCIKKIMSAL